MHWIPPNLRIVATPMGTQFTHQKVIASLPIVPHRRQITTMDLIARPSTLDRNPGAKSTIDMALAKMNSTSALNLIVTLLRMMSKEGRRVNRTVVLAVMGLSGPLENSNYIANTTAQLSRFCSPTYKMGSKKGGSHRMIPAGYFFFLCVMLCYPNTLPVSDWLFNILSLSQSLLSFASIWCI